MAILIDGNAIAADIIRELTEQVAGFKQKPCVAFVRVGEDPASVSYVNKKQATARKIGITSRLHVYPEDISQAELFAAIDQLNDDDGVHGILVQAPLPNTVSEKAVFHRIAPQKDVDGLGTVNLGKIAQEDDSGFISCTPAGIMELLARTEVKLEGKHVVVLGRSLLVGKPIALLAMQRNARANATVTVCHSRSANLAEVTRTADVLIAAIGKPEFVSADMVKPGAVVIDVGINRVEDPSRKRGYRLVGDVDFPGVSAKASAITPVPGGVGPMTVAMLMKNTVKSFGSSGSR